MSKKPRKTSTHSKGEKDTLKGAKQLPVLTQPAAFASYGHFLIFCQPTFIHRVDAKVPCI
jgi:hypothetical protein